jgi:hypothetical protein
LRDREKGRGKEGGREEGRKRKGGKFPFGRDKNQFHDPQSVPLTS